MKKIVEIGMGTELVQIRTTNAFLQKKMYFSFFIWIERDLWKETSKKNEGLISLLSSTKLIDSSAPAAKKNFQCSSN